LNACLLIFSRGDQGKYGRIVYKHGRHQSDD
jgi:hypothetical protein